MSRIPSLLLVLLLLTVAPLRAADQKAAVKPIDEVQFRGRGAGSGVEVTIEAGHLVRFRDGLIVEFAAFASW